MLFRRTCIEGLLGDSYPCRVSRFLFLYRLGDQETGLANRFFIEGFRVNRPNVYSSISSYARSSQRQTKNSEDIYIYSWSLRLSEVKNSAREKLFRGSNKSLEDYVNAKPRSGVIGFKAIFFFFVMLLAVERGIVNTHWKTRLKNRQNNASEVIWGEKRYCFTLNSNYTWATIIKLIVYKIRGTFHLEKKFLCLFSQSNYLSVVGDNYELELQ